MTVTEGDRVLKGLRTNRRKIVRLKTQLDEAYAEQNRLVIAGGTVGLRPADMARAADPEATKALAESFGQTIRKAKDESLTRGKRVAAK